MHTHARTHTTHTQPHTHTAMYMHTHSRLEHSIEDARSTRKTLKKIDVSGSNVIGYTGELKLRATKLKEVNYFRSKKWLILLGNYSRSELL